MLAATTVLCLFLALTASLALGLVAEKYLRRIGLTKNNWRGEMIPYASGILSPLIITIGALAVMDRRQEAIGVIILSWGFMLIGIIDDTYGDRSSGGFIGHFGKLFREGKFTTGVMKAIVGGMLALIAATLISGTNISRLVLNAVIIALTANMANLMDVRPGRALKSMILVWLFGLFVISNDYLLLAALLAGVVIGLMYYDIRESSMLGDAGTGPLGAAIGFVIAAGSPISAALIFAAFLAALHILSEVKSISAIIAANPLLKAIDEFGRKPH